MTPAPTPATWAAALTAAAARRYLSLADLTALARPKCPTCNGKGWTTERSTIPLIGGLSAVRCDCTTRGQADG